MGHNEFINTTLLVEIFGVLPSTFSDEFYDSMNLCFYNVTQGFTDRFIALCPGKEVQIYESIRRFEKYMEEELDRGFNVFQDYFFKNVLRIPQDLDLHPNYCKGIELNMTQEHENLLDLHLEQMRTDIVNQHKLMQFLIGGIKNLEEEIDFINECGQTTSFLSDITKKHQVNDVTFTMKLLKNNLDNLKTSIIEAIPDLRKKLSLLKPEQRTLELRSALQAHINSTFGHEKKFI